MEPVKLVEEYNFDDHTTSDVRVCFKLIDEQPEWFSCHSSVLSQNSKYFTDWLGQNDICSNKKRGVPSAESSRSVRGLGKGVSGKPYPRLCNARRPRLEPVTFQSQAVRLYRLHQARPS